MSSPTKAEEALSFSVVRRSLSVSCLLGLIPISRDVISLTLWTDFNETCHNIHHRLRVGIAEKTVNVRGQGRGHFNNRLRTVINRIRSPLARGRHQLCTNV